LLVDKRLTDAAHKNEGSSTTLALLVVSHVIGEPFTRSIEPEPA
jgi:hypothetical protein